MTDKAQLLLHALSVCVRVFTIPQAMRLLGIQDTANFRRFIRPLVVAELVEVMSVPAKPVPEMREPLFTWEVVKPEATPARSTNTAKSMCDKRAVKSVSVGVGYPLRGGEEPPTSIEPVFSHVIYLARRRWAGRPAVNTTVIVATRKGGKIYGVGHSGHRQKSLQMTHDICLSEIFCRLILVKQVQIQHWHGEDFIDFRLGQKIPDGIIMQHSGSAPHKVIECVGGDYSEEKLLTIARECDRRGLSYEFW